jgi:hypothetical protein
VGGIERGVGVTAAFTLYISTSSLYFLVLTLYSTQLHQRYPGSLLGINIYPNFEINLRGKGRKFGKKSFIIFM